MGRLKKLQIIKLRSILFIFQNSEKFFAKILSREIYPSHQNKRGFHRLGFLYKKCPTSI